MFHIPKAVLVGYGRTQVIQHKCLNCRRLFFPYDKYDAFCHRCEKPRIWKKFETEEVFYREVVDWIQKTPMSARRKRTNFKRAMVRDKFTCRYCEYSPRYVLEDHGLGIDHVKPWSIGGDNSLDNLVACCSRCNVIAGSRIFHEFMDKKIFIVERRKELGLPITEKMWRKTPGSPKKPKVFFETPAEYMKISNLSGAG